MSGELHNKKRVLIVDDDTDMCTIVRDALLDEGYFVDSAKNETEAFSKIKSGNYDIALVDVMLHKDDEGGMSLIGTIKKISPEISVIMVTGCAGRDYESAAKQSGAKGLLRKPFEIEHLLGIINK